MVNNKSGTHIRHNKYNTFILNAGWNGKHANIRVTFWSIFTNLPSYKQLSGWGHSEFAVKEHLFVTTSQQLLLRKVAVSKVIQIRSM